MQIEPLAIPDVKIVTPRVFRDERGFFCETFNDATLRAAGLDEVFVQDNHAMSRDAGVIRGLHLQIAPSAQGKLVRVTKGSIFDVAVDVRFGSPTFARHVARRITAENFEQIWVPVGFAHGYCTLEPDTEVIYKVTSHYDPECERGIQFDDPALAIDWPFTRDSGRLSEKDLRSKPLSEHPLYFSIGG